MQRHIGEYGTFDAANNLSRSDFYDVLDAPTKKNKNFSSLKINKLIKTPEKPSKVPDKLISISVTEDVPLKDVLMEIGRMANLDIQISPKIDSSIIFSAKNKPLREVLDNITEIANVRYKEINGILIFEVDESYVETYDVNFINLVRSSNASKSSSTSLSGSGSASNQNSSSNFALSSKTEDNLWQDIESSIKQIVGEDSLNSQLNQQKIQDKKQKEMLKMAQTHLNANNRNDANNGGGTKNEDSNMPTPPIKNNQSNSGAPIAPNILSQITSQQSQATNPQGNILNQQQQNGPLGQNTISINKQGGLIAIFATKKGHKKIERYLKLLQKKMIAQVLIEVKILEVTLNSAYRNGIDWTNVAADIAGLALTATTGYSQNIASTGLTPFTIVASGLTNSSGNATINILNKFGTVRTLISPRLNATNNQPAVLSRAQNKVYFNLLITNNFINSGTNGVALSAAQQFTVASTPQTVPIGIDLSVHPVINFAKREIMMNVRPSIMVQDTTISDPGFSFLAKQNASTSSLTNEIPVTSAKTFDTMVNIKDGDTMIMGGFTSHINTVTEAGFPIISEIPFFGALFKQKVSQEEVVETVFIIKATIVDDSENNIEESDRSFYDKMANYSRKGKL